MDKHFYRKYRLYEPQLKVENLSNLKAMVDDISIRYGFIEAPKILYSNIKNISPFVFSKRKSKIFLVLPYNFFDFLTNIIESTETSKIEQLSQTCQKYILLHELSHIKNKDVYYFTWLYIFIISLRKYTFLLLLSILFYYSFIKAAIIETNYLLGFLALVYMLLYIFLSKAWKYIYRKRQYLADARAISYIGREQLEGLTKANLHYKGRQISLIELLFIGFATVFLKQNKINKSNLFLNKTNLIRIISYCKSVLQRYNIMLNNLSFFKPKDEYKKRIRFLIEKKYVFDSRIALEKENDLLFGLLLGIIYITYLIIDIGIDQFYVNQKMMQMSQIRYFLVFLFFCNTVLLYTIILSIPLKHSITSFKSTSKLFKLNLLNCLRMSIASIGTSAFLYITIYCIILLLFGNEVNITIPINVDIFRSWESNFIRSLVIILSINIYIIFIIFVATILLSFVFKLNLSRQLNLDKYLIEIYFIGLLTIFSIILLFYLAANIYLSEVNTILLLISFLISFIFTVKMDKYIRLKKYEDLILFKFIKNNYSISLVKYNRYKRCIIYFVYFLILFFPTMFFSMIIIFPILNLLNNTILKHDYSRSIANLFFIITGYILYREIHRKEDEEPLKENVLEWTSTIFCIIRLLQAENCKYYPKNKIKSLFYDAKKIIKENDIMKIDIQKVYFISEITRFFPKEMKLKLSLIKSFESRNGGFCFYQESHPHIEATNLGIRALANADKLQEISKDLHSSYLKGCFYKRKYFYYHDKNKPRLKDNYYALSALQHLKSLNIISDYKNVAKFLEKLWIKSNKNEEETWYFIGCLKILDQLSRKIVNDIKTYWVKNIKQKIHNYRIDKNHREIFYYLSIENTLKIQDIEIAKHIKRELEERDIFDIKSFQI